MSPLYTAFEATLESLGDKNLAGYPLKYTILEINALSIKKLGWYRVGL